MLRKLLPGGFAGQASGAGAGAGRLHALLRQRGEVFMLPAVFVLAIVFAAVEGGGLEVGALALGVVAGSALALQAVGLVLVHRATRVINFAQLQIAAASASIFVTIVQARLPLQGLRQICSSCVPSPRTLADLSRLQGKGGPSGLLQVTPPGVDRGKIPIPATFDADSYAVHVAPRWLVQVDYAVCLLLALAISVLLVWAVYQLIRRFQQAPRLVLTVATVAAGFLAQDIAGRVNRAIDDPTKDHFRSTTEVPLGLGFKIGSVPITSASVTLVVASIAVAISLSLYLRRSATGLVMRGAAENPQRAETLGVNLAQVTARAWVIAGLLGGLAASLAAANGSAGDAGYAGLVRPLIAAVAAGFVSLPLAAIGGIAYGVMDAAVSYATSSPEIVPVFAVVVIVALLVVQRSKASRAELEGDGAWEANRELRGIPAELRALPQVRTTLRTLLVLGGAWLLGYPWIQQKFETQQGTLTMAFGILGLSLLVLTGWAGRISLGQMGFAAIGAWVTAITSFPAPFSLILAALAAGAVSVLFGIPVLRLRGQQLAVSTLALGVAVQFVFLGNNYLGAYLPASVPRPRMLGFDLADDRSFYYFVLVCLALTVVVLMGLRRSTVARVLIATRDNEPAAQSFGLSLRRAQLTAFAISGALAGVAGALIAYTLQTVPSQTFGADQSLQLFLTTIIGGLGALAGPLLGALYTGSLLLLRGTPLASAATLLLNPGLGLLVALSFFPNGLAGLAWRIRDSWLRRLASRLRIDVPSLVADRKSGDKERLELTPLLRPDGRPMRLPARYRLPGQWRVDPAVTGVAVAGD